MSDDLDPRKSDQHSGRPPRILNREVFYRGKTIIQQGDKAFRAYYIEKGRVEVLVNDDGVQLKISELGPGDIFGEMALINNSPRTATIKALDDVTVTMISRDEIGKKINEIKDPAARALINVLVKRLRQTTQEQVKQYKNLAQFQDRIAGVVETVDLDLSEEDRNSFRKDISPLLESLQEVLDRYQK